jgi:hypothetical protein
VVLNDAARGAPALGEHDGGSANNAAHPGDAPITLESLATFYSDINQFVFRKVRFRL